MNPPFIISVGNSEISVNVAVSKDHIVIPRYPKRNKITEALALRVPVDSMPVSLGQGLRQLQSKPELAYLSLTLSAVSKYSKIPPSYQQDIDNGLVIKLDEKVSGFSRYNYKKLTGATVAPYLLVSERQILYCVKLCLVHGNIPGELHYKFSIYPEGIENLFEFESLVVRLITTYLKLAKGQ